LGQAGGAQGVGVHGRPLVEGLVEVADVDDVVVPVPAGVAEAALGDAAEQRHLAALEDRRGVAGAGAGPLALVAAGGGFAHAAARAAADALLAGPLVDALVYGAQVHYRVTPRRRATSSRVRSASSPSMVALTRLIGLVLPWVLVRMLRMPQASRTSRTPGPALTPVPGPAGTRMTRLPPKRPTMRCGIVSPFIWTLTWPLSRFWASSEAFSTAGGTSLALP